MHTLNHIRNFMIFYIFTPREKMTTYNFVEALGRGFSNGSSLGSRINLHLTKDSI